MLEHRDVYTVEPQSDFKDVYIGTIIDGTDIICNVYIFKQTTT